MIRPTIYRKMEIISSKREAWTLTQIANEFKYARNQALILKDKCIKEGILSEGKDRYDRFTVLKVNFKFNKE